MIKCPECKRIMTIEEYAYGHDCEARLKPFRMVD